MRWLLACLWTFCMLPAHALDQRPYRWRNVAIEGGGFVTGVLFHPAQKGLAYARTDVGGAYRWDDANKRWIALTDWLSARDQNLMGIDAFAIDPRYPQALYLAAGTYMSEQAGNGAILRSFDQGHSFERIDLPFRLGGNEQGRGNGERLAVDPHDGKILLLGTRDAGLWRSDDRGAHWTRVESFPAIANSHATDAANHVGRVQPIGIVFVAFDPGSGRDGAPTRRIYAGVSTRQTSLYVSDDGGRHWAPVDGQPLGLRPNHMVRAGDGTWYLSYGDEPGPDLMSDGAVWKYQPLSGQWRDISPEPQPAHGPGFGWGAVAVDPQDPQTLMASSFRRTAPHDDIFRSTNGGQSWSPLFARSRFDHSDAPWTAQAYPHWMASLAIDPFDRDHAMFVTGYGIWASRDLTRGDNGTSKVTWWFQDAGLEETVPLDLLSPVAGAPLLSALGDIDGFVHADLEQAQLQYPGPRLTNGESLDAAGQAPAIVVRSGTVRNRRNGEIRALYSRDGGASWQRFGGEPPDGDGAGHIAIAADGRRVVWAPHDGGNWTTTDFGNEWQPLEGIAGSVVVFADRVDPRRWYGVDANSGRFFISTDDAEHFRDTGLRVGTPARAERTWPQLVADPWRAGTVYLASPDNGVMRWQDGRFDPLDDQIRARSLGVGAPLHDGLPPTLFVAGTLQGEDGLFRSSDGGRHWVRIDDDAHRYGRPYAVTGDPRRPGRVYFATGGRGIVYGDPR